MMAGIFFIFFYWTVPLKRIRKKTEAIPLNEFWFFLFLNYRLRLWHQVAFILLSEACRGPRLLHICAAINVLHRTTGTDQKTNKSTDPRPALLSFSEYSLAETAGPREASSALLSQANSNRESRAEIIIQFKSLRRKKTQHEQMQQYFSSSFLNNLWVLHGSYFQWHRNRTQKTVSSSALHKIYCGSYNYRPIEEKYSPSNSLRSLRSSFLRIQYTAY